MMYTRIAQARKGVSPKLSNAKLGRLVGVGSTTSSQNWEKAPTEGGSAPVVENLSKIAQITGVNFEWLTTGRGPMYPEVPYDQVAELAGEYVVVPLEDPVAFSSDMGSEMRNYSLDAAPLCVTKYLVETPRDNMNGGAGLTELNVVAPFIEFEEGRRYLVRHHAEIAANIVTVQRHGDRWGFSVFGRTELAELYDILGRVVLAYTVY